MSILLTLPDYDATTHCVSEWNKNTLIPIINRNSLSHKIISNYRVNESHVSYTIKKENPRFLIFNGHGADDCICGHNDEVIIKLGNNDNLLDSRIVHSFTCSSSSKLGRNSKADVFIGYDDVFVFWLDGATTTKPLKDRFATPQMRSALIVPEELLKGRTAKEAYDASQKVYSDFIDEYKWNSHKYTTEEIQKILPLLMWNKMNQKIIGNKNSKFR